MTAPAPNKLSNIQSLRGFAALLVVFTHLPAMELKHGGDQILPSFLRFGISGVDLFFVISGFIMVYVTWDSGRSIRDSTKFLFARLTRIYPIYWLIACLVFAVWFARPSLINFDAGETSIVKSFLLWPDHTLPMLKVAWTLIHELYFYLVFALLLVFPRKFLMPGLIVWMVLVVWGHETGWGNSSNEARLITHPLTMEFFMGAVAGWVFKRGYVGLSWAILGLGSVMWLIGLYYLSTNFGSFYLPSDWQRVLYFGFPAVLIVYGLAAIESEGWVLPKWSSVFGDWSYSLYLSHVLSLSVVGYLWRYATFDGYVDNILAIIVMIAASIIVAAAFWYLFEKRALSLFRDIRLKLFP